MDDSLNKSLNSGPIYSAYGRIGEYSNKPDCFIPLFERDCLLSNKGTAMTRLLSRVDYGRLIKQTLNSGQAYSALEELSPFFVNKADSSNYSRETVCFLTKGHR